LRNFKQWALVQGVNCVHVVPMADLADHYWDNCPCGHRVVEENGRTLVIHEAYDQRQEIERLPLIPDFRS